MVIVDLQKEETRAGCSLQTGVKSIDYAEVTTLPQIPMCQAKERSVSLCSFKISASVWFAC